MLNRTFNKKTYKTSDEVRQSFEIEEEKLKDQINILTQQKNEVEEEAKTKLREVEKQMEELKQQNTRDQQEYDKKRRNKIVEA